MHKLLFNVDQKCSLNDLNYCSFGLHEAVRKPLQKSAKRKIRYNYFYLKYKLTYLGLRNAKPYCWQASPTVGV